MTVSPVPPKTTRRQFLQGESALEAVRQLCDRMMPEAQPAAGHDQAPVQPGRNYLLQIGRRAMACEFTLYFNAGQYPQAAQWGAQALDLVAQLEDQMTVYCDHSELVRINRTAAVEPQEVEPRLFALLAYAVTLYEDTDHAFDITAGPLIRIWGFMRRQGRVPSPVEIAGAREQVGSCWLSLDTNRSTIHFQKPGIEINLGGIGKGYALDRCAQLLRSHGVHDFVIHGGRSSIVAAGSKGSTPDAGWSVGVRHPLRPEQRLALVHLRDQALGTSGTATQHFYHRGKRYGHILDPRTGYPAEGVLSTTVVAPDAATADALSTALYVLGPDGARTYSERHPEISALLVCPGSKSGAVQLLALGMPGERWTALDPSCVIAS